MSEEFDEDLFEQVDIEDLEVDQEEFDEPEEEL